MGIKDPSRLHIQTTSFLALVRHYFFSVGLGPFLSFLAGQVADSSFLENWWNAVLSTGLTPTKDTNGGDAKGLCWFPTVVDPISRTRGSARLNHYERVKESRDNYHLLASHTVARVLFQGNQAVGVEYLPTTGGSRLKAYASKEVILSAGAIHTPQVLQLSGVGPKDLLEKLNIDVVSDLPGVGANFQDQPTLSVPYNCE